MELLSFNQRCEKMEMAARTQTGMRKSYQKRDDLRYCYAGASVRNSGSLVLNLPDLD
jgi:hypothetical protein